MMFAAVFAHALSDFTRLRRVLPWLAVAAFLGLLGTIWPNLDPASSPEEIYSRLSLILSYRVLALISAVFSTAVIAQEVEQRTIVYLLTRPIPRPILLLARWLASCAVVFVLAWVCMAACAIGTMGPSGLTHPVFHRDTVACAVGVLAYGALFVLFSLWFNRALIVCLVFAFGWEAAVPNMPGDPSFLSIFSYLASISQHPRSERDQAFLDLLAGQIGSVSIPPATAWAVMIVFIPATVGSMTWWFRRSAYVPREDAE